MSDLIDREAVQREIQNSFNAGAFRWQDGQDLMDRVTPSGLSDKQVIKAYGECLWILLERELRRAYEAD